MLVCWEVFPFETWMCFAQKHTGFMSPPIVLGSVVRSSVRWATKTKVFCSEDFGSLGSFSFEEQLCSYRPNGGSGVQFLVLGPAIQPAQCGVILLFVRVQKVHSTHNPQQCVISPHGVRSRGRHDHAGGEIQRVVEFSIWCFRFGFYTCGLSFMRVCGRLATSAVTMPSLATHVWF